MRHHWWLPFIYRFDKYIKIQFSRLLLISYFVTLYRIPLCYILSNALRRSNKPPECYSQSLMFYQAYYILLLISTAYLGESRLFCIYLWGHVVSLFHMVTNMDEYNFSETFRNILQWGNGAVIVILIHWINLSIWCSLWGSAMGAVTSTKKEVLIWYGPKICF